MDVRALFLFLLVAVLGAVSVLLVLPLLQYVLAAALLAFVLFPIHERLVGRTFDVRGRTVTIGPRISAGAVTALGVVAVVLPLIALSILLLRTILAFLEDFDELVIVDSVRDVARELGIDQEVLVDLEEFLRSEIDGFLDRGIEFVLQELLRLVDTSVRVGIGVLVLVFLLYYFLLDGRRLVAWIGSVAPIDDEIRTDLIDEIDAVTWAVLKSHVLVALVEGLLGGLGLYLLGVPNVAFWTVVMIVVSFLPAIGIWLIWAPAVGYLVWIGEPVGATALLLYGVAVLSVVDNYLRAILVDIESGVHPAVVLVGVIGGIYLFGILGLFLGPVLLAAFKAVLEVFGEAYDRSEDSPPS